MKTYRTNFDEATVKARELVEAGEDGFIVSVADRLAFAVGRVEGSCDREKIAALGGVVYEGLWKGGTCVVFPEDVSICVIAHEESNIGEQLLMQVRNYLKSQGLLVRRNGNDLMLYPSDDGVGYKVGSCGSAWSEDKSYFETVVHISIGTDNSIIEQVCLKPMEKTPAALRDYGVTAEGMINYLEL